MVAYFHRLTKRLEEKNKQKDIRIEHLENGFRDTVLHEIKELRTDMQLIKKIVVKDEKHKYIEGEK